MVNGDGENVGYLILAEHADVVPKPQSRGHVPREGEVFPLLHADRIAFNIGAYLRGHGGDQAAVKPPAEKDSRHGPIPHSLFRCLFKQLPNNPFRLIIGLKVRCLDGAPRVPAETGLPGIGIPVGEFPHIAGNPHQRLQLRGETEVVLLVMAVIEGFNSGLVAGEDQ